MQTTELKIAKIGNSRGVRIPAEVLRRYAFGVTAIMVESVDGILLRPKQQADGKMSWTDTAKAMAATAEGWSDWDVTTSDGLEDIPWEATRMAEKRGGYEVKAKKSQRGRS